jgi:hypothetical protein
MESGPNDGAAGTRLAEALDRELDRRLAMTEADGGIVGFAPIDYFMMILLGALVPAAALFWGWL